MNNSFDRLIDGMCVTLRTEVLTRLDDEFARGQVFGVINLLNTFTVRADWSAEFLSQQIAGQGGAIDAAMALLRGATAAAAASEAAASSDTDWDDSLGAGATPGETSVGGGEISASSVLASAGVPSAPRHITS